jgi:hypothetical protein
MFKTTFLLFSNFQRIFYLRNSSGIGTLLIWFFLVGRRWWIHWLTYFQIFQKQFIDCFFSKPRKIYPIFLQISIRKSWSYRQHWSPKAICLIFSGKSEICLVDFSLNSIFPTQGFTGWVHPKGIIKTRDHHNDANPFNIIGSKLKI